MAIKYSSRSKRYQYGVQWIAENDDPTVLDPDDVRGFISVLLLADLFEISEESVARDVVAFREDQDVS